MRRKSQEIALCGVATALAVTVLLLGGLIPASTYCCPLLAMAVLMPVQWEFGPRLAGTAYVAVALLAALLVPDKEMAAVYIFFGWYPLVKPWLDRLPARLLGLLGKLIFCNAMVVLLYALLIFVFQLDALVSEYATYSRWALVGLLAFGNAVFLLADTALNRLKGLWEKRLRKRFFH